MEIFWIINYKKVLDSVYILQHSGRIYKFILKIDGDIWWETRKWEKSNRRKKNKPRHTAKMLQLWARKVSLMVTMSVDWRRGMGNGPRIFLAKFYPLTHTTDKGIFLFLMWVYLTCATSQFSFPFCRYFFY